MSEEQNTRTPPAFGSLCWIEIPARDPKKLKVCKRTYDEELFIYTDRCHLGLLRRSIP
jgi:hypothetical protein